MRLLPGDCLRGAPINLRRQGSSSLAKATENRPPSSIGRESTLTVSPDPSIIERTATGVCRSYETLSGWGWFEVSRMWDDSTLNSTQGDV